MERAMTLLNGFDVGDPAEGRLLSGLRRAAADRASSIREVVVRDLRLGDCSGCFDCFVRTPGTCRMRDDAQAVLQQILASDAVILAGRISLGGYSATLKRMVDHMLPLLLPFFRKARGDTHHPPRYAKMPRVVGVGLYSESALADRSNSVFRMLVGRNAINLSAPSYAAEALSDALSTENTDRRLRDLLGRDDAWPSIPALAALRPAAQASSSWEAKRPRRALAIVASPKLGPSNSSVLSSYLEGRLRDRGWETESYVLKSDLRTPEGRAHLLAAVERADLVSIAAPLYVDSLHHRLTLALQLLSAERARWSKGAPKRLFAMVNCGFPEAQQNNIALAICQQFAVEAGWAWAGGLALGSGEMLNAQPLDASVAGRPPLHHLRAAIDASAAALDRGECIPDRAQALCDRSPIPGVPRWLWRVLFRSMAGQHWRQRARKLGVDPSALAVRPLQL
jgi:NAD(P)H-dependent FMN reductase